MPSFLSSPVAPVYESSKFIIEPLRSLPVTFDRYTAASDMLSISSALLPKAANWATIASISPLPESVWLLRRSTTAVTFSYDALSPSARASCL